MPTEELEYVTGNTGLNHEHDYHEVTVHECAGCGRVMRLVEVDEPA